MNAERLLKHYQHIADAPDVVARLRRLILDLAVRGKLVPQDANDEPASGMLKRIAREKARLVKAGEIRKPKEVSPLKDYELPFALPVAWTAAPLDQLSPRSLSDGDWIETKDQSEDGGVRLIQLADVGVGEFLDKSARYITEETEVRLNCTRLAEGDVLIARLPNPIGRACIFPEIGQPAITAVDIAILRPDENVSSHFLVLAMNSSPVREQIEAYGKGATRFRVSTGHLKTVLIPLPPLAEQHRIVAKGDELMGLCDRLEAVRGKRETVRDRLAAASLARLNAPDPQTFQNDARFALDVLSALTTRPDQIKHLRQTILNLAVRGRLVLQDANDEPASELLKRIAHIKQVLLRTMRLKSNTPITNSISIRESIELPATWQWASCDELFFVTKLAGFEYTEHFDLKDEGEVPVIRAQNVRPWSIEEHNLKYLPLKTSLILERSAVTKPSILITFIGAGIGDVALIDAERRWHLAPNVAKAELFEGCDELVSLKYVVMYFNSPIGRAEIFKHIKTTAQPSLSMGTIRDVDVVVPPLAEQHRIVAKVDALMTLCDRLEASLTATAAIRRRLLDALLAEALAPANAHELGVIE